MNPTSRDFTPNFSPYVLLLLVQYLKLFNNCSSVFGTGVNPPREFTTQITPNSDQYGKS